jgi:hypothetical protein
MEELKHFYKFRPDEIFRRITVSSLVGLMIEVSKLEYQVFTLIKLIKYWVLVTATSFLF